MCLYVHMRLLFNFAPYSSDRSVYNYLYRYICVYIYTDIKIYICTNINVHVCIYTSACFSVLPLTLLIGLERGVDGSDPSMWGRSPVVLAEQFHSRAISTRGIQSEIVLSYLYYLGFCTVRRGVVHL